MLVCQRVQASSLEELNLAEDDLKSKPKSILIAKDMRDEDKQKLKDLLKQYKDVFAWSFEDMKGLDLAFCQHQILLNKDAKPVQQRRYRLNRKYAIRVKEEIDKLLKVGFIRLVKKPTWLSPIVVVPKKNGKIQVAACHQEEINRLMQEFDKHDIETAVQFEAYEAERQRQTPRLGAPDTTTTS